MDDAKSLTSSFTQPPEDLRRWLLKTEAILNTLFDAGTRWTDQELQAANRCLRIRKQYGFTEYPDIQEVRLKPDVERLRTWEQIPGVIRTGLTVKQVAEIQRLADKKSNWEDRLDDE